MYLDGQASETKYLGRDYSATLDTQGAVYIGQDIFADTGSGKFTVST
jgi:hypothetical protein